MEITEETLANVTVLRLKGRLDAASAAALREKISLLSRENRVKLIADMADVDFIDSSGLGSLVSSLRTVTKLGGDIKLLGLQDRVRLVLEMTRLDRVFGIYGDSQAAAADF